MWKNFKKKVNDFIFEEIEEEIEEVFEEEIIPVRKLNEEQLKTQVTYEYPKKNEAPFRFPLIPDQHVYDEEDEKKTETKTKESNVPIKRKYRRRHKREQNLKPESYRTLYEQKVRRKELEDVPAFMRRKRFEDVQNEQDFDQQEHLERTEEKNIEWNYSKPAELDEVFKRRDQQRERNRRREMYDAEIEREQNLIDNEMETLHREKERQRSGTTERLEAINERPLFETAQQDDVWSDHVENTEPFSHEEDYDRFDENEAIVEQQVPNGSFATIPHYLLNDLIDQNEDDYDWLVEQQELLSETLKHFHIDAKIVAITQGPSVTRIEIQPALGVKVSKIRNLADDIKLNLAAKDIRIEAPIPGKNTVGIEIPNQFPQMVQLKEMIEADSFKKATAPLTIALGQSIEGKPYITNIANMPHGLIAGATGSGKSVCINAIILSLLYKSHYDEVKLLMIDPKMVELTPYNGIPHLISPVITDPKAATMALKWAVDEMEKRYEQFVANGVRNIEKYNEKMVREQGEKMPFIVIVIDELADLMIVSPQEVEDYICRIAQKARAAGIHLILATQRPSVDVITGLIKANIPTRIAFSVSSQVDSRTILDTAGAEKLLGKGDMLYIGDGTNKTIRLQGPFVSDDEIDRVVHHLRKLAKPNYLFEQEELLITLEDEEEDELLHEVISFVVSSRRASTSLLQRRFRIGYNRAARLIDTLHERGIISAQNGSKPREVLLSKSEWDKLNNK